MTHMTVEEYRAACGATAVGGKMRVQREGSEQEALFDWIELVSARYPALRLLFHIPNGGSRHRAEAANLKRQGVRPGVPDLCLPVPREGFHGLFIELKEPTGGRVSHEQKAWIESLRAEGYRAEVCCGFEEAKACLLAYVSPPLQKGGDIG